MKMMKLGKYVMLFVALCAVSCSGYNKLLKSDDPEKKFNTAIELYNQGKYAKCGTLLQAVNQFYEGTNRADSVAYFYGAALYKQGDFVTSGMIFDGFRRRYTRSAFMEDVEYMYAKGLYFSSPASNRDQTNGIKAIQAIKEYLGRYPNSPKKEVLLENLQDLHQRLYDKARDNAKLYYDIGYYNSAVVALKGAIERSPESNHREELSYLVVRSHYLYAKNSIEDKQRQRFLDMQDAYYSFMEAYPESEYKSELDKMQEDAKRYLNRFSQKEQARQIAAEADQTRGERKIENSDDSHLESLKIKPLETKQQREKRTLKQQNEFDVEKNSLKNGIKKE